MSQTSNTTRGDACAAVEWVRAPKLVNALAAGLALLAATQAHAQITCARTLTADVVTIDMPIVNNRLGASNVNGMMFALRGDVRSISTTNADITAMIGQRRNAKLRDDKRPRPLVLRVAAGDCLTVNFQNLVSPVPNPLNAPVDRDRIGNDPNPVTADGFPQVNVFVDEQVADRRTSFHVNGMQLLAQGGIANDGSYVGTNASSLVAPGGSTIYRLYAEREQVYQIVSHGALVGSDANQGNTANGLFGQIIVEPPRARIYRGKVTEEDMRLATRTRLVTEGTTASCPKFGDFVPGSTTRRYCTTLAGHPVINYEATYPNSRPWNAEGRNGLPVLNMIQNNRIVHTEVDAIVVGPNSDGTFPASTYPLESIGKRNPAYPNRLEPFRDFAQVWHDEVANAQAYPGFYSAGFRNPEGEVDPLSTVFAYLLKGVRDKFMINYASGGIGTEILSNRLGVGPMHDCLNCAYEEFFLTAFTVGDVGQLVDIPANAGLETITPQNVLNILLALKGGLGAPTLTPAEVEFVGAMGPKATQVLYPGDPSNVNHSYTGDFVKFRNTHNGFEQHVFHLHNHQWLFNPNDDNSNYLDAQGIGPGMGYTYEIANGGSGNRNKSAGDAIYHCHFYPHFAQGMWHMWRNHDVFEAGTRLSASGTSFHSAPFALKNGAPAAGARAQPDGEVIVGAPIPAVVPLPGKALPPMPVAGVTVRPVARGPGQAPSSSQAVLPYFDVKDTNGNVIKQGIAGPDGKFGTADDRNPGYPFWIAGIACGVDDLECEQGIVGQRPTTPPMDMLTRAQAQTLVDPVSGVEPFKSYDATMKANFVSLAGDYNQMNGGLPRHALHGVKSGGQAGPTIAGIVSPVDLTKAIAKAKPAYFPEGGTEVERTAMATHSKFNIPSYRVRPNGTVEPANFQLNGRPAVPGSPYSDGCRDDGGAEVKSNGTNTFFGGGTLTQMHNLQTGPFGAYKPRIYKGANIQYDAVINKVGNHYPQQRIVSLWEDALPVIEKNKPGEPLVMRLNTFDCAMYHHTNLVPEIYEMDDYQLRTPTDIIGQHIHLPKWDLTTTDGAGNGWNYEDGTLAAGAVRERIDAINCFNGHADKCKLGAVAGTNGVVGGQPTIAKLLAEKHAFFPAEGPGGVDWRGARTTLQRWFADPLLNVQGVDRGLGIVFTHDHYGPSSFQQIGLYSTVLIEPARSTWKHSETGADLGCTNAVNPALPAPSVNVTSTACRNDGGPTSWQAAILTGDIDGDFKNDSYREFYFEYTDFQHAYEAGVYVAGGTAGEPNGNFDEKAYIASLPGVGTALSNLFYPGPEAHAAPAYNKFPAGLNTFRFAIAPPLIKPIKPIFPVLTVEKAVTRDNGALSAVPAVEECIQRPCPTSIDFLEPGTFVVNYRNEPGGLRIFDPNKDGPDGKKGAQADGLAGDLAYVFSSDPAIVRKIGDLNRMPGKGDVAPTVQDALSGPFPVDSTNIATTKFPPHINAAGFGPGDPFTPMLRTYSGDRVRIKAQAGGDEEEHSVSVHGMKWLKTGSGFGRGPNSGWVNQSSGGISEQFAFASPVFMDFSQKGGVADYLYMMDAMQDGIWNGNWGIMRNYNTKRADLFALPNNQRPVQPFNRFAFQGGEKAVCPLGAPVKAFDITAVAANLALPAVTGVTITPNGLDVLKAGTPTLEQSGLEDTNIAALHAGGPLTGTGTLVSNPRTSTVKGTAQGITVNETGPLHDPTAMMYVLTSDLDASTGKLKVDATGKPLAPVEPLALRVNAGDCVQVTLRNRLPAVAADLPNYNQFRHSVKRNRVEAEGSTVFGVNLVRPSSHVGFHTQLLEYDVTRSDGMNVGVNPVQTVAPGEGVGNNLAKTYTFYAGDLRLAELPTIGNPNLYNLDAVLSTAVEFGPVNVLPADKVKQPQKGLYGQLVVQPRGASFVNLPGTRLQADVTAPALPEQFTNLLANVLPATKAQTYRDFSLVWSKMHNHRYASGNAVQNESEEGPGIPENPPHTLHASANYGTEPTFFRFGIPPLSAAGNAGCADNFTFNAPFSGPASQTTCFGAVKNAGDLFSNSLTGGADPATPIFLATPGQPFRIGLTNPNSSNRATTFILHGHVWPRDPFLALRRNAAGFPDNANIDNVGSVVIGDNPLQFYFGAQESVIGSAHYVIKPTSGAGGRAAVPGDYLMRDGAAAGMGGGAWGILRVK
jgi:manganese oxidase